VTFAVARALGLPDPVSIDDDFFVDLGGDSLRAAMLISSLRDDPATANLTVRDVYEARTAAALATRAEANPSVAPSAAAPPASARAGAHPTLATIVQGVWLLCVLEVIAALLYVVMFEALPLLLQTLGVVPFLLLAPLISFGAFAAYVPAALGLTVLVKKILIGRYRPLRAPVWGSFYIRPGGCSMARPFSTSSCARSARGLAGASIFTAAWRCSRAAGICSTSATT
jgi:acyl carrier protein